MFHEKKVGIVVGGDDVSRGSMGMLFGSISWVFGLRVFPPDIPGGGMFAIAAWEVVIKVLIEMMFKI